MPKTRATHDVKHAKRDTLLVLVQEVARSATQELMLTLNKESASSVYPESTARMVLRTVLTAILERTLKIRGAPSATSVPLVDTPQRKARVSVLLALLAKYLLLEQAPAQIVKLATTLKLETARALPVKLDT